VPVKAPVLPVCAMDAGTKPNIATKQIEHTTTQATASDRNFICF